MTDVAEDLFGQEPDIEDAVEAFLKSSPKDAREPSEEEEDDITEADEAEDEDEEDEEDEGDEIDPDDADEEDDEGSEEDDEEGADEAASVASDEAEVVVSVDGKDHRVSVKELKRLYGQEAALTQRSQSLAAQRKAVEAQTTHVATILQTRYTEAVARAEKYKGVDMFRAARELEPEEFEALRSAKENAESEVQKLEQEGQNLLQQSVQTRQTLLQEQAKLTLKEITNPESRFHIPDWSDNLYGSIRTYAIGQGMDAETVNEIVDPAAIKLLHQAMKYSEAQASISQKVQKKVKKAPKRVLRKGDAPTDTKSSQIKAKRRAAIESGDVDDVLELFLADARDE